MNQLPVEIIEKIVKDPELTIEDVISFSSTCHYLRNTVINSCSIWKKKLEEKYSQFNNSYGANINYFEEVQYTYNLKRRTYAILETMLLRFYKKYELSDVDLEEWNVLLNEKEHTYQYLVFHLMEIVNTNTPIKTIEVVHLSTPGNMTLHYYANKVLRYIQQLHLTKVWIYYIGLPPQQQILEIGATLVAQWCQPNIIVSYKNIAAELDNIANTVKMRLKSINPDHGIFKTSESNLFKWRSENLECNQWNVPECRQIITAMRSVVYSEISFNGSNVEYYRSENSYINKVIEAKRGLPISLAVIYEAVGRRLGLVFEPINFPNHFLLRFTETTTHEATRYYIDVFNGGNIVGRNACPHSCSSPSDVFPVATAIQVIERMANNLELSTRQRPQSSRNVTKLRSILELLRLVSPQDLSALVLLAKLYMLHNINTKSLEQYLMTQTFNAPQQAQRILHMLRDYAGHHKNSELNILNEVEVARRTNNLKYAVGMVMKHSYLNYICVIYDWDPMCLATPEWQSEMAVNKLILKNEQPFYNVLVEDGSYRYVAQENLVPTTNIGVLNMNKDLGRYFSHFFENHYVPNAQKEREYPGDAKVRHYFHTQLKTINRK